MLCNMLCSIFVVCYVNIDAIYCPDQDPRTIIFFKYFMFVLKRQKLALLLHVTVTYQSTSSIYLPGARDMCCARKGVFMKEHCFARSWSSPRVITVNHAHNVRHNVVLKDCVLTYVWLGWLCQMCSGCLHSIKQSFLSFALSLIFSLSSVVIVTIVSPS